MNEKDNAKDYERLIKLEDDIYDSDILENYDLFILNCIKFAKENIIPLSKYSNELDNILKQCTAFLENKISKAELEKYYCQLGKKIRLSGILDNKEKEIHTFMSIFLDYNFLKNTPPEDQQDSDICYLLCILYEIKNNLELCNKFYNYISKQV